MQQNKKQLQSASQTHWGSPSMHCLFPAQHWRSDAFLSGDIRQIGSNQAPSPRARLPSCSCMALNQLFSTLIKCHSREHRSFTALLRPTFFFHREEIALSSTGLPTKSNVRSKVCLSCRILPGQACWLSLQSPMLPIAPTPCHRYRTNFEANDEQSEEYHCVVRVMQVDAK